MKSIHIEAFGAPRCGEDPRAATTKDPHQVTCGRCLRLMARQRRYQAGEWRPNPSHYCDLIQKREASK